MTHQIDDLQEPHDDLTRPSSFQIQNFQDREHSVRRYQLTLHLGSIGHDAQLIVTTYPSPSVQATQGYTS